MKPLAAGSLMRACMGWRADWSTPDTEGLELNDERGAAWRAMQDSLAEDALPGSTTALPPAEEQTIENGWCDTCDDPNCYRSEAARLDWRNRLLWEAPFLTTGDVAFATSGRYDGGGARDTIPAPEPV
jgi:hypothetical protein